MDLLGEQKVLMSTRECDALRRYATINKGCSASVKKVVSTEVKPTAWQKLNVQRRTEFQKHLLNTKLWTQHGGKLLIGGLPLAQNPQCECKMKFEVVRSAPLSTDKAQS